MKKNKFISIIESTLYACLFIFSILGLLDIINVDIIFILFFLRISMFKSHLDQYKKRKFLSIVNIVCSILIFFTCLYKIILKYF